jgi:tetratricopeptide (TPR) repeat protein
VAQPVRLVDLAPTLLASTGLPPLPDVDGRDLRPVMEGVEREPRVAYMETLATQLDFGWSPLFALRDARSKYIRAPRPELYDVAADPKELENRAAKEPERIASLDAALAERLSRTVALAQPATLSAAERARLESLGYVVPGPTDVARVAAGSTGIDPKDGAPTLAAMTRASQLLEAGRAGEALSLLRPLSDGGPQLLALRASAALDAGFPAEAESDARAVLAQGSARDDVLVILGDALLLQRRADEAQSVYAQARAVAPESGRPRVGLARVAEAEGNRGAAIAGFREAYDLERAAEASGDAAWRLAALLLESGQLAEADALLAGLPGAATRSQPAVLRLAAAELAAGRTAAAVGRLEAALAEHAESAALQSASGIAYEQAGRWDDSLAARERALALAPDEPAAQNDLAWALARTGGDLDRALALAERAQRAAPRAFEPVDTLAAVRLRRREPAAALAGIEEAVAAGTPAVPILELRRAQALESLGRKSEARRALARAAVGLGSAGAPSAAEGRALASKLGAPWPTD